jgi:hypothetical protein
MNEYKYKLHVILPFKSTTPEQIGQDFLTMIDALSGFDPTLKDWGIPDPKDPEKALPLTSRRSKFTKYVKDNARYDDWDRRDPDYGYFIFAITRHETLEYNSKSVSFRLATDSPSLNYFEFEVGSQYAPPKPPLLRFDLYKFALLKGLSIWPAPSGVAYYRLMTAGQAEGCIDPTFPYSGYHIPWMAYLDADLSKKASVPAEIATERTPDGGLLMIATEEVLDPMNVEHMRRARIIAEIMIATCGA